MSRGWRTPERLDKDVHRELDRLGGGPTAGAGITAVVTAWPQAVGEAIARNAWPARFMRDGTLVVHAASSAWAFELSQLEPAIRRKLAELAPAGLRFVVGPIPEPAVADDVPEVRRSVPRAGSEEARRAAEIAGTIEDLELRDLAARAAAAALARGRERPGTTGPSDTIRKT